MTGVARAIFSEVVSLAWVPHTYKAATFALAQESRLAEFPHSSTGKLGCGRHVDLFRV